MNMIETHCKRNDFIDFSWFGNLPGQSPPGHNKFVNHATSTKSLFIYIYVSGHFASNKLMKSLFLQWFGSCVIQTVNKEIVFTVCRIALRETSPP